MRKTQAIREAIAALLPTNVFTVYAYGKSNITDRNLPAVTVANGTGVWEYDMGDKYCSLSYRIEIHIKTDLTSKAQDNLDDMAEMHVEPLFPIGSTLSNLVEYMNPESFDYLIDDESSIAVMGLNFNVKYEV